jgi:nucleotide-binding universal stress UspA family protein
MAGIAGNPPGRSSACEGDTMTSTVRHDGIAPAEPELRAGSVVVGISAGRDAEYERALRAAGEWAGRRAVDVLLVTGVGKPDPDDEGDDPGPRVLLAEIDRAADHLALQMDPHQRVHSAAVPDSGVAALLAASTMAGLVVLQRRRLGALTRLRAGSTTAAVAARADCPVLIVHADDPLTDPPSDRVGVVVGVDDRGHAASAIAAAFEEASFRGVCLTAVMAWTPLGSTFVPPDDSELALNQATYGVRLAEQLAGYRDRYPDVVVHPLVLAGESDHVLSEVSRHHELLVVARHTDGHGVRRNLGAVTRRIIEQARCPVLVTSASRPAAVPKHRRSAHE